jgi:hypothetical protein
LIASWENLLKWSDNAAVARRLQEEMSVLKAALQNFGLQFHGFDSEESIRDAIEDLKVSFKRFFLFKFLKLVETHTFLFSPKSVMVLGSDL